MTLNNHNISGELYLMLLVTCAVKPLLQFPRISCIKIKLTKLNRKSIEIISNTFFKLQVFSLTGPDYVVREITVSELTKASRSFCASTIVLFVETVRHRSQEFNP